MKKLLVVVFTAASFGLLAEEPADETIIAASTYDIGTYQVTAAQNVTNVLIPVCFKDLTHWGSGTGEIPVAQIMKVSNLTTGDKIVRYNGAAYDAWNFNGTAWEGDTTIDLGKLTFTEGDTSTCMPVGSAMWMIRANPSTEIKIQLFGKYVAPLVSTSVVERGTWNLMANPTGSEISGEALISKLASMKTSSGVVSPPQKGDKLITIDGTRLGKTFTYSSTKAKGEGWFYGTTKMTGTDASNMSIPAHCGFWYYAKTGSGKVIFDWGSGD